MKNEGRWKGIKLLGNGEEGKGEHRCIYSRFLLALSSPMFICGWAKREAEEGKRWRETAREGV